MKKQEEEGYIQAYRNRVQKYTYIGRKEQEGTGNGSPPPRDRQQVAPQSRRRWQENWECTGRTGVGGRHTGHEGRLPAPYPNYSMYSGRQGRGR
jgi:hypothetical protein